MAAAQGPAQQPSDVPIHEGAPSIIPLTEEELLALACSPDEILFNDDLPTSRTQCDRPLFSEEHPGQPQTFFNLESANFDPKKKLSSSHKSLAAKTPKALRKAFKTSSKTATPPTVPRSACVAVSSTTALNDVSDSAEYLMSYFGTQPQGEHKDKKVSRQRSRERAAVWKAEADTRPFKLQDICGKDFSRSTAAMEYFGNLCLPDLKSECAMHKLRVTGTKAQLLDSLVSKAQELAENDWWDEILPASCAPIFDLPAQHDRFREKVDVGSETLL